MDSRRGGVVRLNHAASRHLRTSAATPLRTSWRFKSSHPRQRFPADPGKLKLAKLVRVDAHDLAVFMNVLERLDDRKRGMYLCDHHERD